MAQNDSKQTSESVRYDYDKMAYPHPPDRLRVEAGATCTESYAGAVEADDCGRTVYANKFTRADGTVQVEHLCPVHGFVREPDQD